MGHVDRRHFLVASLSAAGGLAMGIAIPGFAGAEPIPGQPVDAPSATNEVNAWVVIDPDDSVTIRVAKSEMGQGVLTSLAMIVAEELGCDWNKVKSETASANRNVREKNVYKLFLVGGSASVSGSRPYLQQAGASARARLIEAAARRWKVPAADCQAADSKVTHTASGRTLSYGALAAEAAKIALDKEPAIKTPDQFTLLGKPMKRIDVPSKVTGQAIFGMDVKVPDMLYAAVVNCPVPGGTLKSYDEAAIKALPGVKAVVPIPFFSPSIQFVAPADPGAHHGIAVVADRFWQAKRAADALQVEWDYGAGAGSDSAQFAKMYRDALDGPLSDAKVKGDVAAAFAKMKPIEATYEVPYLAHATMEPLNCTAHVQPDRIDIWMGTQAPDFSLQLAARFAGVSPDQVYVHACLMGGGFGRRVLNDEMIQAIVVSKAVGKPVKLIWTREEDMRSDRYRPQAALRLKGSLDAGVPVALEIGTAVGSINRSVNTGPLGQVKNGVEDSAVEGLADMGYAFPNLRVACVLKNTHIPVSFWRSVGSTQNAFALESFIDEMAHTAGEDPYQFRRKLLLGNPRFLRVLDTAAEKGDWGKKLPAGKGRGIAIHENKGTVVAETVEVAIGAKGEVRVERVVAAVDCGHVINPLTATMQIESGIIYGLTAALFGEITVKNGRIEQGNFDSYRMVRLAETPQIETHFSLTNGEKWSGVGEPGTPPVAPALCNAIFAATGKRIRQLPIRTIDLTGV